MAHNFLDRYQINAGYNQVRGTGMTEYMKGHTFQFRLFDSLFKLSLKVV